MGNLAIPSITYNFDKINILNNGGGVLSRIKNVRKSLFNRHKIFLYGLMSFLFLTWAALIWLTLSLLYHFDI